MKVLITGFELGRRSIKRKFLELCQDVNGEEFVDISHWVFLCQTGEHNVLIDSGPYNWNFFGKMHSVTNYVI